MLNVAQQLLRSNFAFQTRFPPPSPPTNPDISRLRHELIYWYIPFYLRLVTLPYDRIAPPFLLGVFYYY